MTLLQRYPLVVATVLVGVIGGGLWLAGVTDAPRYLFSGFGLIVAGIEFVATLIVVLMLTGESLPVERERGDPVLSGSINGQAATVIRASASAENSQYQRIIALVQQAAGSKAPVVRLADRYAVPFTVVALGLAGAA